MTGARWRRLDGQSPVLLAALAARLFGVAMLACALIAAWRHFPDPRPAALLALGLTVEAGLTSLWWWRTGTVGRATLLVGVPTGVVAMLVNAMFAQHHGAAGWTGFAYQYFTLLGLPLGYAVRTWYGGLIAGAVWGVTSLVGLVVIEHQPAASAWPAIPTFLVAPLVGWTTARMLRRGQSELDTARVLAEREAAELSTERERSRHARALHDRVLQEQLETLARGARVAPPGLALRIVDDAAWLRRYIESGQADQGDDLSVALEATARAMSRPGLDVQVNDAALRTATLAPLPAAVRDALLGALHQTLRAMAGAPSVVIRGEPHRGGVLVTVHAPAEDLVADQGDLERAGARLRQVGGTLRTEPFPYAELWVPGSGR